MNKLPKCLFCGGEAVIILDDQKKNFRYLASDLPTKSTAQEIHNRITVAKRLGK